MILVCSLLVKKGWSTYVYWVLAGCVVVPSIVQGRLQYTATLNAVILSVAVFVRPKLRRVAIDNPQTKKLLGKPNASIQE